MSLRLFIFVQGMNRFNQRNNGFYTKQFHMECDLMQRTMSIIIIKSMQLPYF